jgi:hypothetical protein
MVGEPWYQSGHRSVLVYRFGATCTNLISFSAGVLLPNAIFLHSLSYVWLYVMFYVLLFLNC